MKNKKIILVSLSILFLSLLNIDQKNINAQNNFKIGEKIFLNNCNACHKNGGNIIIPEKNLKKETLETNGMNNLDSIMYQIINGKNGMPAFGNRLKENEIKEVARYVIEISTNNFEK